jgi:hypothetical protein
MLSKTLLSVAILGVGAAADACAGGEWDVIVVGIQDSHTSAIHTILTKQQVLAQQA